ncbi:MAG: magnesium/cobalt transporter CorA [Coriobacteriia bacterium]|nr:magnesium/cobalt transporter CorA [Coriobacteriia bacterium]
MPATVTVRWVEGGTLHVGDAADIAAARDARHALWIDVLDPDEAALAPLGAAFGLHPLALEDCLHFPQRVKIDLYPEAAFLVWIFPRHGEGSLVSVTELDIFLGDGFLITSHRDRIKVIDDLITDAARALSRGPDWVLHSLLDRGVDELFPIVDHLADQLDQLEDVLLDDPVEEDLQRLYALKRALIAVYRIVGGERDVLRSMARRQEFVSQDAYLYFQDVGDHLARAVDAIDTYRDVASSAMDLYLSAVNNRLSDVMKRLTIVATLFMPLTLISGIYGMNVTAGMWPPVTDTWSFPVVIVTMVVIATGMLIYFKRRRWW